MAFSLPSTHIHVRILPNALPMPIQRLANNLQRINLAQAVTQLHKQSLNPLSGLEKLHHQRRPDMRITTHQKDNHIIQLPLAQPKIHLLRAWNLLFVDASSIRSHCPMVNVVEVVLVRVQRDPPAIGYGG